MLSLIRAVRLPLLTLAAVSLLSQTRALGFGLTNNNSFALVDPTSQAGMNGWYVLNSPGHYQNELNQQWFWYRVGNTSGESSIDHLTLASVNVIDPATVTTTFNDPLGKFSISIKYSLTGGSATSGAADISEQISINNISGAALDFHFFQYSDFNLSGPNPGDFDLISRNPFTGRINQVDQMNAGSISEVVLSPNASHGETDVVPFTLNKLNDALPTILDDSKTSASGNVAWALQWDVNIADGGSFLISKDKTLQVVYTPEPSTFALFSLGLAAVAVRRRRNAR